VHKSADFCAKDALKFTYAHTGFQGFFRRLYSETPVRLSRETKGMEKEEGKEWDAKGKKWDG
jgi:hypothetical protein